MIIYKYLKENDARKTLNGKSVLLNHPSKYNDPFDCVFNISDKEMKRAYKLFINYGYFKALYKECVVENKQYVLGKLNTKLLKENLIVLAKTIKAKKKYKFDPLVLFHYEVAKILTGKNDDELVQEFNKIIEETLETIRHSVLVSCFSLVNDSILMWSHYAKSHSGACVELDIDDSDFKIVKYSKKPVKFKLSKIFEYVFGYEFAEEKMDYSDSAFLFALKPFLTKFIDWQYEKEVRCGYSANLANPKIHDGVDDDGNPIKLLDVTGRINAIYLGCNASESFLKEIKEKYQKIPLYKMKKVRGEYKLEPEKIN